MARVSQVLRKTLGRRVHAAAMTPPAAPPAPPAVQAMAASGVTANAATLHGTVNPNGLAATWLVNYGPTASYGSSTPPVVLAAGAAGVTVTATLTGLAPNTTYHYEIRAANAAGSGTTGDQTFTTQAQAAPSAVAGAPTGVGTTAATLNGTVNPNGLAVTDYHFRYGLTTSYGSSTTPGTLPAGTSAVAVSASLTGLSSNTVYHYQLLATTAGGTSATADQTFTTAQVPAPAVVTSAATGVGTGAATLNGTVNPNGGAASDYHFEYGTSTAYGSSTPPGTLPAGASAVAVSASLTGLSPSTTYHYRLDATNPGGTTRGADQAFTTGAAAPPSVVTNPATAIDSSDATLNGTVNPNGLAVSDYHFEYGPTASYGSATPAGTLPAGSAAVPVSAVLVGLAAGTAYHYRLDATTTAGTVSGADQTFTTPAAGPPPGILGSGDFTFLGAFRPPISDVFGNAAFFPMAHRNHPDGRLHFYSATGPGGTFQGIADWVAPPQSQWATDPTTQTLPQGTLANFWPDVLGHTAVTLTNDADVTGVVVSATATTVTLDTSLGGRSYIDGNYFGITSGSRRQTVLLGSGSWNPATNTLTAPGAWPNGVPQPGDPWRLSKIADGLSSGLPLTGLTWDPTLNGLWLTKSLTYGSASLFPTLSFSALNDQTLTWTPAGPWRFQDAGGVKLAGKLTQSFITFLPAAYAAQYTGGRTLVVGDGGYYSIGGTTNSLGLSALAVSPPALSVNTPLLGPLDGSGNPTTDDGLPYLTAAVLSRYDSSGPGVCARPATYINRHAFQYGGLTGTCTGTALQATAAGAITAPGSGYVAGDVLTDASGLGGPPAQLTVTAVNGQGGVTGVSLSAGGFYTPGNTPANPATFRAGVNCYLAMTYNAQGTTCTGATVFAFGGVTYNGYGYTAGDVLTESTSGVADPAKFLVTATTPSGRGGSNGVLSLSLLHGGTYTPATQPPPDNTLTQAGTGFACNLSYGPTPDSIALDLVETSFGGHGDGSPSNWYGPGGDSGYGWHLVLTSGPGSGPTTYAIASYNDPIHTARVTPSFGTAPVAGQTTYQLFIDYCQAAGANTLTLGPNSPADPNYYSGQQNFVKIVYGPGAGQERPILSYSGSPNFVLTLGGPAWSPTPVAGQSGYSISAVSFYPEPGTTLAGGSYGGFGWTDAIGGAAYLSGANKRGMVYFPSLGVSYGIYYNSVIYGRSFQPHLFVTDPADMGAVALGQKASNAVIPAVQVPWNFAGAAPSPPWASTGGTLTAQSVSWDPANRIAYVTVYRFDTFGIQSRPAVYAYRVNV